MGKKVTLYLIDGTDNGPRTVEIGNWSGKAVNVPRAALQKQLNRDEYANPGVYILKGTPEKNIYSERIYIGEAEDLRKRIKQHLADVEKDFNECVIFISKDELLTKSHIKYIESRLVILSREASNCELENKNTPTLSRLSEADISDMEYFIEQIRLILPTIGYEFLIDGKAIINLEGEHGLKKQIIKFQIKKKDLSAYMLEGDNGFIVLKGSEANLKETKSLADGWRKIRKKLIDNGSLTTNGQKLIFQKDVYFTSPSAASSVVLGRQSAGPLEWIDENGKSLKEYETE